MIDHTPRLCEQMFRCLQRERCSCFVKRSRKLLAHTVKLGFGETERVEGFLCDRSIEQINAEAFVFGGESICDVHDPRNVPRFSWRAHWIMVMTASERE